MKLKSQVDKHCTDLSEDVSVSAMRTKSSELVLCVQWSVHMGKAVIQQKGSGVVIPLLDKVHRFLNKFAREACKLDRFFDDFIIL